MTQMKPPPENPGRFTVLIAAVGLSAFGVQLLISAVIISYYPPLMRSTAVGSASGFGRLGAFLGPLAIGAMLASAIPPEWIIASLGALTLGSALCAWLLPGDLVTMPNPST